MNKIRLFFAVLLIVISYNSQAIPFYWPIVYHMDLEWYTHSSGVQRLQGTVYWDSVKVEDDTYYNGSSAQVYNSGIGFVYRSQANSYLVFDSGPSVMCNGVSGGNSYYNRDCLNLFYSTHGTSGSFYATNIVYAPNLCFFFNKGRSTGNSGLADTPSGMGLESCYKVVEPDKYCVITSDNIVFDFGVVHTKEIETATAEAKVAIECSSDDIKYSLKTGAQDDAIILSNALRASVNINGSPVSTQTLNGSAGTEIISLESRLSGTPTQSGSFTGTGILYVMYQ